MVKQPSEPAYTAERNAGIDPFARAVAGLREIYDSADPVLIPAIESNIIAFQVAVRRDKEIQAQRREIDNLKKRVTDLETTLTARQGEAGEERIVKTGT